MTNWALIVGINQYEHFPENQSLRFATADARAMRSFLIEQAGFATENLLLCTDDSEPIDGMKTEPSRSNLRRLLLSKLPPANAVDHFWFFFSGHGVIGQDSHDYLMTSDALPEDVEETALEVDFVVSRLRRYPNVVLVLDACRNQLSTGGKSVGGIGDRTQALAKQNGITTIFSCSRGQQSFEIEALGQGAFTHALIEGLQQHRILEGLDLFLRDRVPQLTQQHRCPRQVPLVIPEPGEKYRQPVLPVIPALVDGASSLEDLKRSASEAEAKGEFALADRLYTQILQEFPAEVSWALAGVRRVAGARSASTAATATVGNRSVEEVQEPEVQEPQEQPAESDPDDAILQTFSFEVVTVDERGQEVERKPGRARSFFEELGGGVVLEMVRIPGGKFLMGSPEDEEGRDENEGPQHWVTVPDFYMGKYPVTQDQWAAVARLPKVERKLDESPSYCDGNTHPVEQVSWYEAVEFCARLSQIMDHTYRLPSEAEWEYACRAGTQTPFSLGPTITQELATYRTISTTDVGSFPANAFGLHDMHGNIWEWCRDNYCNTYKDVEATNNAHLIDSSLLHVRRGGSWLDDDSKFIRSACRDNFHSKTRQSFVGFRIACGTPRTS